MCDSVKKSECRLDVYKEWQYLITIIGVIFVFAIPEYNLLKKNYCKKMLGN